MKTILFCLFSFFALNVQSQEYFKIANSDRLLVKQEGAYWCWAATLEAMAKWEGKKIKQSKIMKKESKMTSEEIEQNKDSVILSANPNWYIQKYLKGYNDIPKENIEKELKKNKPIVYMANNHVSIIVGFNENEYVTMDTFLGQYTIVPKTSLRYRTGFDVSPAQFFSKK